LHKSDKFNFIYQNILYQQIESSDKKGIKLNCKLTILEGKKKRYNRKFEIRSNDYVIWDFVA